jgi:hypothetical protein
MMTHSVPRVATTILSIALYRVNRTLDCARARFASSPCGILNTDALTNVDRNMAWGPAPENNHSL